MARTKDDLRDLAEFLEYVHEEDIEALIARLNDTLADYDASDCHTFVLLTVHDNTTYEAYLDGEGNFVTKAIGEQQ